MLKLNELHTRLARNAVVATLLFSLTVGILAIGLFLPVQAAAPTQADATPTPGSMTGMEMPTDMPFDAMFIDSMIEHHQGAIDMAEMVLQQAEHQELHTLAEGVFAAQSAEIEQMQGWRSEWYKDLPPTGGLPMAMGDMTIGDDASMPFDQRFLEAMISHHQGAIDMAKMALGEAEHEEIHSLATNIITAQESEIEQMHGWQAEWHGDHQGMPATTSPVPSTMPMMPTMPMANMSMAEMGAMMDEMMAKMEGMMATMPMTGTMTGMMPGSGMMPMSDMMSMADMGHMMQMMGMMHQQMAHMQMMMGTMLSGDMMCDQMMGEGMMGEGMMCGDMMKGGMMGEGMMEQGMGNKDATPEATPTATPEATPEAQPSATAVVTGTAEPEGAAQATPHPDHPLATAPQSATAGAITVEAIPVIDDEILNVAFAITLETHSVELDFDVAERATLTIGDASFAATSWIPDAPSGHHVTGTLHFTIDHPAHAALMEVGKVTIDLHDIDGEHVTLNFAVAE